MNKIHFTLLLLDKNLFAVADEDALGGFCDTLSLEIVEGIRDVGIRDALDGSWSTLVDSIDVTNYACMFCCPLGIAPCGSDSVCLGSIADLIFHNCKTACLLFDKFTFIESKEFFHSLLCLRHVQTNECAALSRIRSSSLNIVHIIVMISGNKEIEDRRSLSCRGIFALCLCDSITMSSLEIDGTGTTWDSLTLNVETVVIERVTCKGTLHEHCHNGNNEKTCKVLHKLFLFKLLN